MHGHYFFPGISQHPGKPFVGFIDASILIQYDDAVPGLLHQKTSPQCF